MSTGSAWLAETRYAYEPAWRVAAATGGLHDLSAAYAYLTNSALVEHFYYMNGSSHVMTTTLTQDLWFTITYNANQTDVLLTHVVTQ